MKTNRLNLRCTFVTALMFVFSSTCLAQAITSNSYVNGTGGTNATHRQSSPYLILISIDGFGWDYMDHYPTPNMDRIAANGSRAERLLPVFPTLTFPNHYSIATGLYPEHHGIVANDFPDPARNMWYSLKKRETVEDRQFYAGEPIWVTAESQGMVAASFFFVGTEAPIKGISPTHWRSYDKKIPGRDRVDQVLDWLKTPGQNRPHIYTLYFEDVDDYSHWYGPGSEENIDAISRVDGYIGRLLDGLDELPFADQINIILLSDHGQGDYLEGQPPYLLADHVNLDDTDIIEGGSYLFLHLDDEEADRAAEIVATVNNSWKHGRAYLPRDTPAAWHIGNNPRFPDVILMPDAGYAVLSSEAKNHKINKGDHGWAPEAPAMHGFFVACGPNIKQGISLGAVNNIDVYPLMLSILGLEATDTIDGDSDQLANILYTSGGVQSCSKR